MIHAIALYTMGDVHGAIVKCWPEVAGMLGSGRDIRTMLALTH